MLTLPIKKHWFDEIASGRKPEEYRNITEYYKSRFKKYAARERFKIRFRAGYRSDSPLMECEVSLFMGQGNTSWGAEPYKRYFILKIINKQVLKE